MAREKKGNGARGKRQAKFEPYRHDEKRKNNPPAKIANEGVVPAMPKTEYHYSPRLPPVLRFDPNGKPDKLPKLLAEAKQRVLTDEETKILAEAVPHYWREVLTLACYMILSDKPMMYCSDWISSTETHFAGDLSSQRISELLVAFGAETRHAFFKAWVRHISEQEYIALDITSISSYSELVTENEWGYNRDHENLPQINLCMLLGEQSRLPIYQTVYSGSLKDVSTLQCTLSELTALVPEKDVRIVMDKGFFSVKNINALLSDEKGQEFLISVPFTSNFACKQVEIERNDIDQIGNTIITSGPPIRGVHRLRAWETKEQKLHTLHTHILYNPQKALRDRNDLYGYVTDLIKKAETDPHDGKLKGEFDKYLIICKSEKQEAGYTIKIRDDVINKQLRHAGWLVLISNTVSSTQEAHDLYRIKDVVEKGFCKFKNSLGLSRLLAAVIERNHDDRGIIWPVSVAPYHVYLCALYREGSKVSDVAEKLYTDLEAAGVEVLFNDREDSPGVKFNDAD
jgi:hypothetical protein